VFASVTCAFVILLRQRFNDSLALEPVHSLQLYRIFIHLDLHDYSMLNFNLLDVSEVSAKDCISFSVVETFYH